MNADRNVIDKLFKEFHYADDLGVIKSKLTEYIAVVQQKARAAAFREAAILCREQESPEYDIEVMASGWEDCKLHCAEMLEAAVNSARDSEGGGAQ